MPKGRPLFEFTGFGGRPPPPSTQYVGPPVLRSEIPVQPPKRLPQYESDHEEEIRRVMAHRESPSGGGSRRRRKSRGRSEHEHRHHKHRHHHRSHHGEHSPEPSDEELEEMSRYARRKMASRSEYGFDAGREEHSSRNLRGRMREDEDYDNANMYGRDSRGRERDDRRFEGEGRRADPRYDRDERRSGYRDDDGYEVIDHRDDDRRYRDNGRRYRDDRRDRDDPGGYGYEEVDHRDHLDSQRRRDERYRSNDRSSRDKGRDVERFDSRRDGDQSRSNVYRSAGSHPAPEPAPYGQGAPYAGGGMPNLPGGGAPIPVRNYPPPMPEGAVPMRPPVGPMHQGPGYPGPDPRYDPGFAPRYPGLRPEGEFPEGALPGQPGATRADLHPGGPGNIGYPPGVDAPTKSSDLDTVERYETLMRRRRARERRHRPRRHRRSRHRRHRHHRSRHSKHYARSYGEYSRRHSNDGEEEEERSSREQADPGKKGGDREETRAGTDEDGKSKRDEADEEGEGGVGDALGGIQKHLTKKNLFKGAVLTLGAVAAGYAAKRFMNRRKRKKEEAEANQDGTTFDSQGDFDETSMEFHESAYRPPLPRAGLFSVSVPQNQACIVERGGKYHRKLKAGSNSLVPCVDRIAYCHSLKEMTMPIPNQVCYTTDNVPIHTNGLLSMKIEDPVAASYDVDNPYRSIVMLTQTVLRNEIGSLSLERLLENRNVISDRVLMQASDASRSWGVRCLRFEVRDLEPPPNLKESMEREAEAERQKRLQVLQSEAEREAAINRADGQLKAQMKLSQARQMEIVNQAIGEAHAIAERGEAIANAMREVAEVVREPGGEQAMQMRIAEQYIQAYRNASREPVIPPPDPNNVAESMNNAIGLLNTLGEGSSKVQIPAADLPPNPFSGPANDPNAPLPTVYPEGLGSLPEAQTYSTFSHQMQPSSEQQPQHEKPSEASMQYEKGMPLNYPQARKSKSPRSRKSTSQPSTQSKSRRSLSQTEISDQTRAESSKASSMRKQE